MGLKVAMSAQRLADVTDATMLGVQLNGFEIMHIVWNWKRGVCIFFANLSCQYDAPELKNM